MMAEPQNNPTSPSNLQAGSVDIDRGAVRPSRIQDGSGADDLQVRPTVAELLLPQSLSGVFDEAFDVYKRHFRVLALTAALLYFPTQILLHAIYNLWLRPLEVHLAAPHGMEDFTGAMLLILGYLLVGAPQYGLPGVIFLIMMIVTSGPVCLVLSDLFLGSSASVGLAYRRALPTIPKMLTGWLIALCAFCAVAIAGFFCALMLIGIVAIVSQPLGSVPATVLLFVAPVAVYIACMALVARYFLFTTQLVVLENTPLSAIWERNWQLVTQKRFRRTWGAATFLPLVVLGLQYLILSSFNSALTTLAPVLDAFHLGATFQFMTVVTFTALTIFFLQPYGMVFVTLLYFDYRIRRDALDVRVLSDRVRAASIVLESARDSIPSLPTGPHGQGSEGERELRP